MIKPVRRKPLAPSGPLLAAPAPSGGLGITRMRSRASRAVCGSGFGSRSSSPGSAAADQGGWEGNPGAPCATSPGGCGLGAARARCDLRGGDTGGAAAAELRPGAGCLQTQPTAPVLLAGGKGTEPGVVPRSVAFQKPLRVCRRRTGCDTSSVLGSRGFGSFAAPSPPPDSRI